jgi:hypothetical protein
MVPRGGRSREDAPVGGEQVSQCLPRKDELRAVHPRGSSPVLRAPGVPLGP